MTKPLALAGSWETAGASAMNNSVSSGHLEQADTKGVHAGKACSHMCMTDLHSHAMRRSLRRRNVADPTGIYTPHEKSDGIRGHDEHPEQACSTGSSPAGGAAAP